MNVFDIDKVKVVDIEITTACNAACPLCPREQTQLNFDKRHNVDMSLEDFKKFLDQDFIKQLEKIQFVGSFGDPASAKDIKEIIKYVKLVNPKIVVGLNTNGGLRSKGWWADLASLLPLVEDYVIFSIDGLEDTNHIYRKNVKWNKLIENVQAFVSAGGRAHWDMLVFDHNKHQINDCEQLAKELGFKFFRTKHSIREYSLFEPVEFVDRSEVNIECFAVKDSLIHITSTGLCLPCPVFGDQIFVDRPNVAGSHKDLLLKEKLNLHKNNIKQVFKHFNALAQTWHTTKPVTQCLKACDKNNSLKGMWKTEKQFN